MRHIDKPIKHTEMFRLHENNQYENIIKRLSKDSTNNDAVAIFYDPAIDNRSICTRPCIKSIYFDVENNKVNLYAQYFVSNVYTMGLLDLYQMAYLLEKIVIESGMQKGKIILRSHKAYINLIDLKLVKNIFLKEEISKEI